MTSRTYPVYLNLQKGAGRAPLRYGFSALRRSRRAIAGRGRMSETDRAAERMRIAQDLVSSPNLDIAAALALLNTLPSTLGPSVQEAVEHAKRAVAGAPGGDHRHQAVARYMVARVLVLLEGAQATPPLT